MCVPDSRYQVRRAAGMCDHNSALASTCWWMWAAISDACLAVAPGGLVSVHDISLCEGLYNKALKVTKLSLPYTDVCHCQGAVLLEAVLPWSQNDACKLSRTAGLRPEACCGREHAYGTNLVALLKPFCSAHVLSAAGPGGVAGAARDMRGGASPA